PVTPSAPWAWVNRLKSADSLRVPSTSSELRPSMPQDLDSPVSRPIPSLPETPSVSERMVVHAGGVIRIICYVSGQPSPEVTWSRDGMALPPEAKVETTAISSSLVIKPCSRRHLGIYTVTAKNAAGEKRKNVTVEVLGESLCAVK
uniref:Ig-like domain-containing protein n=1 Tax=Hippocampus comes TaxID=109280 RepID=A0A3Q2Y6Y1_HIPCM